LPRPRQEQLTRLHLVRQSDLARDVTAFIVDRQARGLSLRTVEYYASELRCWQAYLEARGLCRVQDLAPDHLRQYLLHLQESRNAGGVHCAYRALRSFLCWAWAEFDLPEPCPIAKVHAPRVPQEPLTPVPLPDLKAMLDTCERRTRAGDRDRAMLLCLLDSGCRASEFTALDVADVNAATGAVVIRHAKGGKFRTVFLGSEARMALLRYLRHRRDKSGALWLTDDAHRLTYAGLRQVVVRRARLAGVPVPGLHSFRRAFCLAMLRGGADLLSVSRLLGHADLGLIARYAKQVQDDLAAAHAKAGPVDRLLR